MDLSSSIVFIFSSTSISVFSHSKKRPSYGNPRIDCVEAFIKCKEFTLWSINVVLNDDVSLEQTRDASSAVSKKTDLSNRGGRGRRRAVCVKKERGWLCGVK